MTYQSCQWYAQCPVPTAFGRDFCFKHLEVGEARRARLDGKAGVIGQHIIDHPDGFIVVTSTEETAP